MKKCRRIKQLLFGVLFILIALLLVQKQVKAEESTFKLKPGVIAEPDFYTFNQDGSYNTNIFCAQRDSRFTKGWVCSYHSVDWQENAGIFKDANSFKSMTWLKNNFLEKSASVTNLGKLLTNKEKADLLSTSGINISESEVAEVFNNNVEKFKLYQELIWTYTNGKAASPNSDLSGATLKIYNALKILANNNTAGEIKINAAGSPTYIDTNWVWNNFEVNSTYPLPYNLSVFVDGAEYTSFSYDKNRKVLTINGLSNESHTFDVIAYTYRIESELKIWLNDDINDGYDGVAGISQNLLEISTSNKVKKYDSVSANVEGTINGKYDIYVHKIDDSNAGINGAEFRINNGETVTTGTNGKVLLLANEEITEPNRYYEYIINEINAPNGYVKLKNPVKITLKTGVVKSGNNKYYSISNATFTDNGENIIEATLINGKTTLLGINNSFDGNEGKTTITVNIINPKKQYDLALTKSIMIPMGMSLEEYDFNFNGQVDLYDSIFTAELSKALLHANMTGNKATDGATIQSLISTFCEDTELVEAYQNMDPSDVFDKFDLKGNGTVNSFYLAIISRDIAKIMLSGQDRINGIYNTNLNKTISDELQTSSNYNMDKSIFAVNKTDIITYRITVYNEGDYAAKNVVITDKIPQGLVFCDTNGIPVTSGQVTCSNGENSTTWVINDKTATTTLATETPINAYQAYSAMSKQYAYINCKIEDSANIGDILYNVAEITSSTPIDEDEHEITGLTDRDSTDQSLSDDTNSSNIVQSYKNRFEGMENNFDSSSVLKSVYDYEDDDDFERIIVKDKTFDLALRKSITKVGVSQDNMVELSGDNKRLPEITTGTVLDCRLKGNGSYEHKKEYVEVEKNNYIEYTIRVYNEGTSGDYDGYASQITDYLPDGLEFFAIVNKDGEWITVPQDDKYITEQNKFGKYEATYDDTNKKVTINLINTPSLTNKNYLAGLLHLDDSTCEGYYTANDSETINNYTYAYQEVKIICKVSDNALAGKKLTNIAEITGSVATEKNAEDVTEVVSGIQDEDSNANSITIGDSMNISSSAQQVFLKGYYDYKQVNDTYNGYYSGIEDDDDFETVYIPQDLTYKDIYKEWNVENPNNYRATMKIKSTINGVTSYVLNDDGTEKQVIVKGNGNARFKDLPKFDNNNVEIEYTIEETKIEKTTDNGATWNEVSADEFITTIDEGIRNLADVVQIGDIINYNPSSNGEYSYTTSSSLTGGEDEVRFSSKDNITWQVLSVDKVNGIVNIMATNPTEKTVTFEGKTGYKNATNTLNRISEVYSHGYGAVAGRSILLEDIQEYSSYNKSNYTNLAGYRYGATKNYTSGTFINGHDEDHVASSSNSITMTQNAYWYTTKPYISYERAYDSLMKDESNNTLKSYWTATRSTYLNSSVCGFYLTYIQNGRVDGHNLYISDGRSDSASFGVVPVITLSANIKTTGQNGDGKWVISEGTTIKNTLKTSISRHKQWEGIGTLSNYRASFELFKVVDNPQDGETTKVVNGETLQLISDRERITIVGDGDFTYDNLPAYEGDKKVEYRVVEVSCEYYNIEIEDWFPLVEGKNYEVKVEGNIITNKVAEETEVQVNKSWSVNDPNKYRATYKLYRVSGIDGEGNELLESAGVEDITVRGNHSGLFKNLPKYEEGQEIKYRTEETKIEYTEDNGDTWEEISLDEFFIEKTVDEIHVDNLVDVVMPGDYIKYNQNSNGEYTYKTKSTETGSKEETTFSSAEELKWRVLSVNKATGVVEIMAENPTDKTITFSGSTGYKNAEKVLNNIGGLYGHGLGAASARSINLRDIDNLSSFNKANYTNMYGYQYGTTRTYSEGRFTFDDYSETTADSNHQVTVAQTAYWYIAKPYFDNTTMYNQLFKDTDENDNKSYWIATPAVYLNTSNAGFYMNVVKEGKVDGGLLYNSFGKEESKPYSVVPVVTLNADLKTLGRNEEGEYIIAELATYQESYENTIKVDVPVHKEWNVDVLENYRATFILNKTFKGETEIVSDEGGDPIIKTIIGDGTAVYEDLPGYKGTSKIEYLPEETKIEKTEDNGVTWVEVDRSKFITTNERGNSEIPSLASVVKIGDYVNYDAASGEFATYSAGKALTGVEGTQTFNSTDNMKWRVLSINNGTVELIAADDTDTKLKLHGISGYKNAVNVIEDAASVYGHGLGSVGAKSISLEDIDKYSSHVKEQYVNIYGYKYGDTVTYSSGRFINEDDSEVTADATGQVTVTQTASWYYAKGYFENESAYRAIFRDETNESNRDYYLPVKQVFTNSEEAGYYVGTIKDGIVDGTRLFNSNNTSTTTSKGIVPVVYLQNQILTSGQDENGAWNIIPNDDNFDQKVINSEITDITASKHWVKPEGDTYEYKAKFGLYKFEDEATTITNPTNLTKIVGLDIIEINGKRLIHVDNTEFITAIGDTTINYEGLPKYQSTTEIPYIIVEVEAHERKDEDSEWIKLEEGNKYSNTYSDGEITNTIHKTSITAYKEWDIDVPENYRATISLKKLVNGELLDVTDDKGNAITKTIVGNGSAIFDNLPKYNNYSEVDYKLEETKIEKKIIEDGNEVWEEVDPDTFKTTTENIEDSMDMKFKNTAITQISKSKEWRNVTNANLYKVVVGLYEKDDDTVIETKEIIGNSYATFNEVELTKEYEIKEEKAYYRISENSSNWIELTEGTDYVFSEEEGVFINTINNDRTTQLTQEKEWRNVTNANLYKVVLKLYEKDSGTALKTEEIIGNNSATFDNLSINKEYEIKEEKAYYRINESSDNWIELTEGIHYVFSEEEGVFINTVNDVEQVKISKRKEWRNVTNANLYKVVLGLYEKDSNTVIKTKEIIGNGTATFENLSTDKEYEIKEKMAYYRINERTNNWVALTEGTDYVFSEEEGVFINTINDYETKDLSKNKEWRNVTDANLYKVVLGLYEKDNDTVIETRDIIGNGTATFENLSIKKEYEIREEKAYYRISEDSTEWTELTETDYVVIEEEGILINIIKDGERKVLSQGKEWRNVTNANLYKVVLGLYEQNDETVIETIEVIGNNIAIFEDLAKDKEYEIKEEKAYYRINEKASNWIELTEGTDYVFSEEAGVFINTINDEEEITTEVSQGKEWRNVKNANLYKVVLGLYEKGNDTVIKTGEAIGNSSVTFDGLDITKEYEIKEEKAYYRISEDSTEWTELTEGTDYVFKDGAVFINTINNRTVEVSQEKEWRNVTNANLYKVVLGLYEKDDDTVIKTGEAIGNSSVTFNELDITKEYEIKEEKAYYRINEATSNWIELTEGTHYVASKEEGVFINTIDDEEENITVDLSQAKEWKNITNANLFKVKLVLYEKDNETPIETKEIVGNNTATFENLSIKKEYEIREEKAYYRINEESNWVELTAGTHYVASEEEGVFINTIDEEEDITVDVSQEKEWKNTTNANLFKVVLALYEKDNETAIETKEVIGNNAATFENLSIKKEYEIREEKAYYRINEGTSNWVELTEGTHYVASKEEGVFINTIDDEEENITVDLSQAKEWKNITNANLFKVKLVLYEKDNETPIETKEIIGNNTATFENLSIKKEYEIREEKAYYRINEESNWVELTAGTHYVASEEEGVFINTIDEEEDITVDVSQEKEWRNTTNANLFKIKLGLYEKDNETPIETKEIVGNNAATFENLSIKKEYEIREEKAYYRINEGTSNWVELTAGTHYVASKEEGVFINTIDEEEENITVDLSQAKEWKNVTNANLFKVKLVLYEKDNETPIETKEVIGNNAATFENLSIKKEYEIREEKAYYRINEETNNWVELTAGTHYVASEEEGVFINTVDNNDEEDENKTIDLTQRKEWRNVENANLYKVELALYEKDNETAIETKEVIGNNAATFENLSIKKEYEIKEEKAYYRKRETATDWTELVKGTDYVASESEGIFINTIGNEETTIDLTQRKEWRNVENANLYKVVLGLYEKDNETAIETKEVIGNNTAIFEELSKDKEYEIREEKAYYRANERSNQWIVLTKGTHYVASEEEGVFINTVDNNDEEDENKTIDLTQRKEWRNVENANLYKVVLGLYEKDNETAIETKEVIGNNTATFEKLSIKKEYEIKEEKAYYRINELTSNWVELTEGTHYVASEEEGVFINTVDNNDEEDENKTIDLTQRKEWRNIENANLYKVILGLYEKDNETAIETKEVIGNNSATFENLSIKKEYEIREEKAYYRASETSTDWTELTAGKDYVLNEEEGVFINTAIDRTTIDITGTKTWVDENEADRPESITIRLYANGSEVILEGKSPMTVRPNEEGIWSYSIIDLPKYDENNTKIEYTISEDAVAGYKSEVNGYNITNTRTKTMQKQKEWRNITNSNQFKVIFELYEKDNEELIETKEVIGNNTAIFENLDITKDYEIKEGKAYYRINEYSVTWVELTVGEDYIASEEEGVCINTVVNGRTTQISRSKEWKNVANANKYKAIFELYEIGVEDPIDEKEVIGNAEVIFEGIDITKAYEIREKTAYYRTDEETNSWIELEKDSDYEASEENDIFINTMLKQTTHQVQKLWVGAEKESVIVELKAKDNMENEINIPNTIQSIVTLSNENNWKYTWEILPTKIGGVEVEYSVEEISNSDGYKVEYALEENKTIITNIELTTHTVQKLWNDKDNEDEIRPQSIQVQLQSSGEAVQIDGIVNTAELNDGNSWTYTWTNLPIQVNGVQMNYEVKEITEVEGYTATYSEESNNTIITNTHQVKEKQFDLSLRKFISKVEQVTYNRAPDVNVSPLKDGDDENTTTAIYKHSKSPIRAKLGNTIVYTIRVYNEGDLAGYATEITDYLPNGLEFIDYTPGDGSINDTYGWTKIDDRTITTRYLSNRLLAKFKGSELDFADVLVECRIKVDAEQNSILTNIAEITKSKNEQLADIIDRDSEAGNKELPSDEELSNYKDNQEDDDDFEKVYIVKNEYDLSLRKFISKVNDKTIENRAPVVELTDLINRKSTTAKYNHTKDPIEVCKTDIITYTLRAYNEGTEDAYAGIIKDDIPNGLEFVTYESGDGSINDTYRWKMLDIDGNPTEEVSKAKFVVTDYLAKDVKEGKLIKAFNPDIMEELDYKDVQVQFRVTDPSTSDRIITNRAQISEETDSLGNNVTDRDSTPDKWNEGEDDQDQDNVKVKYFDLSLKKWVTQLTVIRNGELKVTETGYTAETEKDEVVKVDIAKKEIDDVIVKFTYSIRVTNDGQLAGEVQEITDYIPSGLTFNIADNPEWTQAEGKATTSALKGTILQPGESAEVKITLTWANNENNLGIKTNVAEISKDHNEFETSDIDSIPNNKDQMEDDIDYASVMVTIKTGEQQLMYILMGLGALTILASGIYLVKRKVVNEK